MEGVRELSSGTGLKTLIEGVDVAGAGAPELNRAVDSRTAELSLIQSGTGAGLRLRLL